MLKGGEMQQHYNCVSIKYNKYKNKQNHNQSTILLQLHAKALDEIFASSRMQYFATEMNNYYVSIWTCLLSTLILFQFFLSSKYFVNK